MNKNSPFILVRKALLEKELPSRKTSGSNTPTSSNTLDNSILPMGIKKNKLNDRLHEIDYPHIERQAAQLLSTPQLVKVFNSLDSNFKRALTASLIEVTTKGAASLIKDGLNSVTRNLARRKKVLRVGILDMGNWISELPSLLEKLNAAQTIFTMFEIQAPVPSGLVRTPEGMAEWLKSQLGGSLGKWKKSNLQRHVIATEYFEVAEDIRVNMGLDIIVGLTPAMIAGESDGQVYWNHISSTSGKTIIASTADMRLWAKEANRPFEAAIGALLIPTLLIAINEGLEYHDEDTGCLFDYNGSRDSFVDTLKKLRIEKSCKELMTLEQIKAADAMLAELKKMKRVRDD